MIAFASGNSRGTCLEPSSLISKINNTKIKVRLTSKQYAYAATIAAQIESLQEQLDNLLNANEIIPGPPPGPKASRPISGRKPAPSAPTDGSETRRTLTPAVVRILKRSRTPLKARDIYDALLAQGYPFKGSDPKKTLGIRLYKMAGVQVLGAGLFEAK